MSDTVTALWRFPVKSMLGERVDEVDVTLEGVVGDRAYALIETDTGKVVSAKSTKKWPAMFQCRAAYVEPPGVGEPLPPVRITLPDGTDVASDAPGVDKVLSVALGGDVTLALAAPEDFTIDNYAPDVEGFDPDGHRDVVTETRLGAAFFAGAGLPSPVPAGSFFDLFPISVMTTSTLDQLNQLAPDTTFDARRFRMNVIIQTSETGFVENGWLGRVLAVGHEVRLQVVIPDPRCVMTSLAQDDLPADVGVLRTMTRHNRLEVLPGRPMPCAGVYAVVESGGTIRIGQPVT